MGVSRKEVEHIAKLANLFLTPEEMKSAHLELEKILGLVSDLTTATDVSLQSAHDTDASSAERPDVVQPSLSPEEFMSQAPASVGTAFQVPRIIEQDH